MRALDLSVGIAGSIIIHLLIGIYLLGGMLAKLDYSVIVPEFKHGLSSIEVNLVSLSTPEPEPEIQQIEPETVAVIPEKPLQQDEPPEEQVPEQILDEGVEQGDPEVTTDIKPAYPLGARMRGEEGVVAVKVWIDASGRTRQTEIMNSSGYSSLDGAALKALRKAQFRDAGGSLAHSRETTVTFRFQLTD